MRNNNGRNFGQFSCFKPTKQQQRVRPKPCPNPQVLRPKPHRLADDSPLRADLFDMRPARSSMGMRVPSTHVRSPASSVVVPFDNDLRKRPHAGVDPESKQAAAGTPCTPRSSVTPSAALSPGVVSPSNVSGVAEQAKTTPAPDVLQRSESAVKWRRKATAALLTFGVFSFYGAAMTVNASGSTPLYFFLFLLAMGRVLGFLIVLALMKLAGNVPPSIPVSW